MMQRSGWGLLLAILFGLAPMAAADGAIITGRVELTLPDGQTVYGDWLRVLLVTEPVEAAAIAAAADRIEYESGERINRIHLDFFKAVSERINAKAGYVAASTLTTEDGAFKFPAMAPGRYWVLVTFPAMIGGCKVAWQAPVTVGADAVVEVVLNNENLLFEFRAPRTGDASR